MKSYQVSFRFIEGTTNVEPSFLDESAGDYQLIEVTDACVSYRCNAELFDEQGTVLGYVYADGSCKLIGGCP